MELFFNALGQVAGLIKALFKPFKNWLEKKEESRNKLALVHRHLDDVYAFCSLSGTLKYVEADVGARRGAIERDYASCLDVIAEIYLVLGRDPSALHALDRVRILLGQAYTAQWGHAGIDSDSIFFAQFISRINSEISPCLEMIRQDVRRRLLPR